MHVRTHAIKSSVWLFPSWTHSSADAAIFASQKFPQKEKPMAQPIHPMVGAWMSQNFHLHLQTPEVWCGHSSLNYTSIIIQAGSWSKMRFLLHSGADECLSKRQNDFNVWSWRHLWNKWLFYPIWLNYSPNLNINLCCNWTETCHLEDTDGAYLAPDLSWWELTNFYLCVWTAASPFVPRIHIFSDATGHPLINYFDWTFQSFDFWKALNDFMARSSRQSYFYKLLVGYLGSWNPPVEKNQSHNMLMLSKYQPRSVPGIKAVNLFALQHIKVNGLLLRSAVCQEKAAENLVWLVIKKTTTHFLY